MISIIDRCSFLRAISAALSPCLLASWVFMPPSTKSLAIFRRLNAEAICKAVSPFCIDTSYHNLHTFLNDITQLWIIYPYSRGAQHQLSGFSLNSVFEFVPGWMEYEGSASSAWKDITYSQSYSIPMVFLLFSFFHALTLYNMKVPYFVLTQNIWHWLESWLYRHVHIEQQYAVVYLHTKIKYRTANITRTSC